MRWQDFNFSFHLIPFDWRQWGLRKDYGWAALMLGPIRVTCCWPL